MEKNRYSWTSSYYRSYYHCRSLFVCMFAELAGIAPLFLAAKQGKMEVVRSLVQQKANVNARGGGQEITALHWAAFNEIEELAVFLIQNGANVAAMDMKGRTPLTMASTHLQNKMKGEKISGVGHGWSVCGVWREREEEGSGGE